MSNLVERTPIMQVRSLCKDFRKPNGQLHTILENVNFDVYDNEVICIVGTSGSGKTTLMRCLAGLESPDRGVISYNHTNLQGRIPAGFVFQDAALFPWLTVRENISIVLDKLSKAEREKKLDSSLALFSLAGFEDCYPRELSTGMKKRVSMCRAVAANPLILIMDDPFSGVDPLTAESISGELLRIWLRDNRQLSSIIIASNSPDEALFLADRILLLSSDPGEIVHDFQIEIPRPRNTSSDEFHRVESIIRNTFGEMNLNLLTEGRPYHKVVPTDHMGREGLVQGQENTSDVIKTPKRVLPLINTSLILVEGLLNRLSQEESHLDLYEICDEMGEGVDVMLPAVASAEILGFLETPGTKVVLTPEGRKFALERDPGSRVLMFQKACLKLPMIAEIYEKAKNTEDKSITRQEALATIGLVLPFEDPDTQFEALLKWTRHADLMDYDNEDDILTLEE